MASKWVSRRAETAKMQKQPGTDNGAGQLMDDAAIASRRMREKDTEASAPPPIVSANFDNVEAADALSNLWHNTLPNDVYECGEIKYKPATTAEDFNKEILAKLQER